MSACIELDCRIEASAYAALEELLEAHGALAITSSGGDVSSYAEPGIARDAWGSFTVRALFDADADLLAIMAAVQAALGDGVVMGVKRIDDAAWTEVWKERWQPLVFGDGLLCVCPTWREPPAAVRHVIRLDPGQAFGTGTHETTALCLAWLATLPDIAGMRVIDYGCGSGILALAAARLGAPAVLGIDVDDQALAVARDNVRLNGLQSRVTLGGPDLARGEQTDLVIANILLEPLLSLAPRFAELLPAGGRLALAGILREQADAVLDAYDQRFNMTVASQCNDWILMVGRRR